jgi:hypothetical protein
VRGSRAATHLIEEGWLVSPFELGWKDDWVDVRDHDQVGERGLVLVSPIIGYTLLPTGRPHTTGSGAEVLDLDYQGYRHSTRSLRNPATILLCDFVSVEFVVT